MESFWQWLMRANAKGVFFCSIGAFLLVCGWWTWKEFAPREDETIANMPSRESPHKPLGVIALMEKLYNTGADGYPATPFLPPLKRRARTAIRPVAGQAAGPDTVVAPNPGAEPGTATPGTGTGPGTAAPSAVSLTYRGLIKMTDGRDMALIEDSTTKNSLFYTVGGQVYGMPVAAIDKDSVQIVLADGSAFRLILGKREVFEGGRHDN